MSDRPYRDALDKALWGTRIPPYAKLVMAVLLVHTDNTTGLEARFTAGITDIHPPDLRPLSAGTGMCMSTVAKYVRLLAEHGWLTRESRGPGGEPEDEDEFTFKASHEVRYVLREGQPWETASSGKRGGYGKARRRSLCVIAGSASRRRSRRSARSWRRAMTSRKSPAP